MNWTKDALRQAKKILSQHSDLSTALPEISSTLGGEVSPTAIRDAFRRAGWSTPISHLAPTPIVRQERKEDESRKDREIKALVEELKDAKVRTEFIEAAEAAKKPPKILAREKTSKIREMTPVILASDWHVEEPVEAESVAYRNEYNLDIADVRVKRFFDSILWNVEHQRASGKIAIRDLVLWLGGDLMSGYIHPELQESNELSPTETVRWLLPRLRNGIYTLLNTLELDRIIIPCSYGNHGRTTDKIRISTGAENSYEWLMYHVLREEFRNEPRIEFEVTKSPHQYVEAYDFTLHFHHGDSVKYAGGVGGLAVPLLKAVPQWDLVKKSDYHHIGHFHSISDFGRAVVNGSLIGFGPYSQRIRAAFEKPAQMMYYLDKTRGKTMVTPLWVAE